MRELFKSRALSASYPPKLFTFHSLRSGFICSALLKAGTNANAVKAILENTAFIAGWVPNQAAQLRYVKECGKKTIISSRLVMPTEENLETNIVDTFLSTSEAFHSIKLSEPIWPADLNYRVFQKTINEFIKESIPNSANLDSIKLKFWRNAYYSYVNEDPNLTKKAKKLYTKKKRQHNSYSKKEAYYFIG